MGLRALSSSAFFLLLLLNTVAGGAETPSIFGVPEAERETQRTGRLRYEGGEGDVTLLLVFRLRDAESFSLEARDRLGRPAWTLAAAGESGVFVNHRDAWHCELGERFELDALPIGPLGLRQIPALLLGRLPIAVRGRWQRGEREWSFQDELHRTWMASVAADGSLERWSLWQEGEPSVWWQTLGDVAYLSSRDADLQLRWKLGRAESLKKPPLGPGAVPTGSELVACR